MFDPLRVNRISTHAPLAGRDEDACRRNRRMYHISTHAPLAGRDITIQAQKPVLLISTHAPLAGRDLPPKRATTTMMTFQPTRPLRGATTRSTGASGTRRFQPTRPLRGATLRGLRGQDGRCDFNPRAPCGARLFARKSKMDLPIFQPTRPLRGATAKVYKSLCTFLR